MFSIDIDCSSAATADLLVINKVDLAPHVGADVDAMVADARARRGDRPVIATAVTADGGADGVAAWVRAGVTEWRSGSA